MATGGEAGVLLGSVALVKLSVVMSVYNGEDRLRETLHSIFSQTESDFELIVVDDGSTDRTPDILAEFSDDHRLRVITQANTGLTLALIRGCSEARGAMIGRHDCGDRSHPDRFRKQLLLLENNSSAVLASCATSHVAPNGEPMYIARGDGENVRRSLLHDGPEQIRGLTHHGSAMFRRDAYIAAGGYRSQFYFAQDLDLWVRLAALGEISFAPEVLYEARFDPGTISWTSRPQQVEMTRLIVAIRDNPDDIAALLQQASAVRRIPGASSRALEARALYFIASCLRQQQDPSWRGYVLRAIATNPLLVRAWVLLMRGLRT